VISQVTEADLPDLLPLVRGYCRFYEAAPSDDDLLALSRELLAAPDCHGVQLIARGGGGEAVGFATVYWGWSTLAARRTGIMNDLFVASHARGGGVGKALIEACADACREHGVTQLVWYTAKDNFGAQALYEQLRGDPPTEWLEYSLRLAPR
jgi:GNAT superfamily N-acetyltransferase